MKKIRVIRILVGIILFITGILFPEAKFDYPQCISFAGSFIASTSIGVSLISKNNRHPILNSPTKGRGSFNQNHVVK